LSENASLPNAPNATLSTHDVREGTEGSLRSARGNAFASLQSFAFCGAWQYVGWSLMEVDKLPVSSMPVSKVRAPRFCGWAYLFVADADHGEELWPVNSCRCPPLLSARREPQFRCHSQRTGTATQSVAFLELSHRRLIDGVVAKGARVARPCDSSLFVVCVCVCVCVRACARERVLVCSRARACACACVRARAFGCVGAWVRCGAKVDVWVI
jgi:hypothetical protein